MDPPILNAKVSLDPVSLSFGAVPSGSGQTRQMSVALTNVSGGPQTYSLAISGQPAGSVAYNVSPSSLTLAAGATANAVITMAASQGAPAVANGYQAFLEVKAGGTSIGHAALFTLVK
ncbi:MAG: hypothetical protein JF606_27905 [Burkholderiales bacterium]|nr:hypothetical protein [Burkholderiales bacterium]